MRQLPLLFRDDGDHFTDASKMIPAPFGPDVERILAAIAEEEELARATPEDRQRHWARVAAEERRAARESRRSITGGRTAGTITPQF